MPILGPSNQSSRSQTSPGDVPSSWRDQLLAILKLIAVPVAVTLAMVLPDQLVKWANFTTGVMVLNNPEKTEILRKVFDKCGGASWTVCANYDAERWAQDANIYLAMVEDSFEKRYGGKLRKSIAQLFRSTYIRASFYESLSGEIKHCTSLLSIQLSQTADRNGLDYPALLSQYNEIYGLECGFLYDAFSYPRFENEAQQPEQAVTRRIKTIDRLTEALAIRADSKIPAIRARLTAIEKETLEGLTNVCRADIPGRSLKLSDNVDAIESALYSFGNNRTSILDLEQSEEDAARAFIKNILLTLISLMLIVFNAKRLGHAFNELWITISHHG
jgi:hypothetical protein